MTRGHSAQREEIKKYLFHELTQAEQETFEERLFKDDEYFYHVMNLENDLVDQYALKKLEEDEVERFEHSLRFSPERREKVANAVALQRLVVESGKAETAREQRTFVNAPKSPLQERLSNFFSFRTPSLRYTVAVLVVLLVMGFLFLLVDRLRVGRELARLREGQGGVELQRIESELREQLEAARVRETELRRQIESESGKSEVLNEQLERERVERASEGLRREQKRLSFPTPRVSPGQVTPTVASIFLLPGGRGAGAVEGEIIGRSIRRISISLELEQEVNFEGRLSVEVNNQRVATNLEPKSLPSQRKVITFSVSPQSLVDGANRIVLKNADGLSIGDYELKIQKR